MHETNVICMSRTPWTRGTCVKHYPWVKIKDGRSCEQFYLNCVQTSVRNPKSFCIGSFFMHLLIYFNHFLEQNQISIAR